MNGIEQNRTEPLGNSIILLYFYSLCIQWWGEVAKVVTQKAFWFDLLEKPTQIFDPFTA